METKSKDCMKWLKKANDLITDKKRHSKEEWVEIAECLARANINGELEQLK